MSDQMRMSPRMSQLFHSIDYSYSLDLSQLLSERLTVEVEMAKEER